MKVLKAILLTPALLFWALGITGQEDQTNKVLTPEQFNQYLLTNHPIAEKAGLIETSGRYEVKKARGHFDPKLFSEWNTKNYQGARYYQVNETGLKIPTWLGLDLKLYHQDNSGQYLNPENTVPGTGLYGVGVSLPIGEGLFTDERRTALNKAKVIQKVNQNRKEQLLINLLNQGFQDYWEWVARHHQQVIVDQTMETAKQRFENVKESFLGGEKQAMDTTDALSQWQRWQVKSSEIQAQYEKQRKLLATYLWDQEQNPVSLEQSVEPPDILSLSIDFFEQLKDQALKLDSIPDKHPAFREYRNKLEILSIENRWKKEQIKPELDFRYHALQEAPTPTIPDEEQLTRDMKWGVSFEFPIFLRKELNSLRLNNVKRKTTELDFKNKKQTLQAKLSGLQALLSNLYDQIQTNQQNLDNYERLVEAERIQFDAGESDLFRVNYREMTYLKARMDQIDYITDFFKTFSKIMYQYQLYKEGIEGLNQD